MSHPLQVQIICTDPNVAAGVYANGTQQTFADDGSTFTMDFFQSIPNTSPIQALLRARVTTSPLQAKRVLRALAESVHLYEERFGPIQDPLQQQKPESEEEIQ